LKIIKYVFFAAFCFLLFATGYDLVSVYQQRGPLLAATIYHGVCLLVAAFSCYAVSKASKSDNDSTKLGS
jgi:hypothetical protein